MLKLTKKNGKFFIEASIAQIPESGKTIAVRPDYGNHVANDAEYDFQITGLGKIFDKTVTEYVEDEEYGYDGQRPVNRKTVKTRRAYGHIVARHGACQW